MRPLVLLAIVLAPTAAVPAFAQTAGDRGALATSGRDLRLPVPQRNFSVRVSDVVSPDGSRRKRTAIIAGVEVAPDTMVGVGLFDSMPKARLRGPDPRLDGLSKRSRKAAIGMTFRF
ncbi:MAG TPA: hypothetical protein VFZ35_06380 [Sphingomicrobium sp.]